MYLYTDVGGVPFSLLDAIATNDIIKSSEYFTENKYECHFSNVNFKMNMCTDGLEPVTLNFISSVIIEIRYRVFLFRNF